MAKTRTEALMTNPMPEAAMLVRNKLRLALNVKEAKMIVNSKEPNVFIDGKPRKALKYPVGFMDVLSTKSGEHYRCLYDIKGRFNLHKINQQEAEYKLCKVKDRLMGKNRNPYIITHDGRTLRFPDPHIKKNDSIKLNLTNFQITATYKYQVGAHVMITGGNNIGRTGVILKIEKHPGSYEIIHVKDENGIQFNTRLANVFVIGTTKPEISILKKHCYLSIVEEKEKKTGRKIGAEEKNQKEDDE